MGDGSTSTYFTDKLFSLVLGPGSASPSILVKASALLTFGELIDATLKTTKNGFYIYDATGAAWTDVIRAYPGDGTVYLYSMNYAGISIGKNVATLVAANAHRIWNALVSYGALTSTSPQSDLYNITSQNTYGYGLSDTQGTMDRITVQNTTKLLYSSSSPAISNAVGLGLTGAIQLGNPYNAPKVTTLIDCVLDNWTVVWAALGGTGVVDRKYTFNLHLEDSTGAAIDNAAIILTDKDGNTVLSVSTGADGKIAQQTVTYKRYYYSSGAQVWDYSPHTLTITKAGYQIYQDVHH